MLARRLSSAYIWLLAVSVIFVASQEPGDGEQGVDPLVEGAPCETSGHCSTPSCAGGGRAGVCVDNVCHCQVIHGNPPTDDGQGNEDIDTSFEGAPCETSGDCSTPSCAGGGRAGSCIDNVCRCEVIHGNPPGHDGQDDNQENDQGDGDSDGNGNGDANDDERPPASPTAIDGTPSMTSSEITNEDGSKATVVVVQGGAVLEPITVTANPTATDAVSGDSVQSIVVAISSSVIEGILPLVTAWTEAPEPGKAQPAIDGIRGLLPAIVEVAGGLGNGQEVFECAEIEARDGDDDDENELDDHGTNITAPLQKFNCDLLTILGYLEENKESTDPATGEKLQQPLGNLPQDLTTIVEELGEENSNADPQCSDPEQCDPPAGNDDNNEDDNDEDEDNDEDDDNDDGVIVPLPLPLPPGVPQPPSPPGNPNPVPNPNPGPPPGDTPDGPPGDSEEPEDDDNEDDDNEDEDEDEDDDEEDDEDEDEEPECDSELLPGGIVQRRYTGLRRRQDGSGDGESCELGVQHAIYPGSSDAAITKAIHIKMLTMIAESGIKTVEASGLGVLLWWAVLTPQQAKELQEFPGVSFVYIPCQKDCYDPTIELVMQADAEDDLVVASQFSGQPLEWYKRNYVYHERGGRDVDVYILDTGANLEHQEFTMGSNLASRARWIHASTNMPESQLHEDDYHEKNHGTCMLARAAGYKLGIAKHINPIIVRVLLGQPEQWIDGLAKILDDIGSREKRAVLSMSYHIERWHTVSWKDDNGQPQSEDRLTFQNADGDDGFDSARITMGRVLKAIAAKGVSIVTGSGNKSLKSIEGIPASLANPGEPDTYIESMIIVGAVSPDGSIMWQGTNLDEAMGIPHIYAPGYYVECTQSHQVENWETTYRRTSGTSMAAAATAGMTAYMLSIRDLGFFEDSEAGSPKELKDYLMKLSYSRGDNPKLNVFYNGIYPSDAERDNSNGPGCRIESRQLKEDDLPDWPDCNDSKPTTLLTTTREPGATDSPDDENDDGDAEENADDSSDSDTPDSCSSGDDCKDLKCSPAEDKDCKDEKCVCVEKKCTVPEDCFPLKCKDEEVKACDGGKCICKENKCAESKDCGFLKCRDGEEAACKDKKCSCQEKEKTCSKAEDDCKHLECKDTEEPECKDDKCACKQKYKPGVCRTHIAQEGVNNDKFSASAVIFDGGGTEIGKGDTTDTPFGETMTVESKLPYKVEFEFLEEWLGSESKRDRPEVYKESPQRYQTYSIRLKAGIEEWDTEVQDEDRKKVPTCEVGRWDNPNNWIEATPDPPPTRDMDCYWKC